MALLEDLALYDNKSWNDPRDFAKPVKAIALPQDVLRTSDHSLIELENQVQRLMEAHLNLTQPTQVNKQDDMVRKINLLWKTVSENLNDAPIPESAGDSMAFKNIASINHIERDEESEAREGEITTNITPKHGHNITKEAKDEVKEVIDEEEGEVEIDEEIKEILEDKEEEEEDEDGKSKNKSRKSEQHQNFLHDRTLLQETCLHRPRITNQSDHDLWAWIEAETIKP
ncbi:hypothetical protein Tco_0725515 [Tanacetum coccineum]|uniref:MAK10-like protein n=1 Tax=Tanacetum coccineum TaxID=301880 RepID=A0ABQ4YD27_9ASTR